MAEQNKLISWWHAPMTICALQCEAETDPLAVADTWAAMGYNTEQLLHPIAEGYFGLYQPELHRDALEQYIERAGKLGLRIILYLNTHIIPISWETEHPEFFARNKSGEILTAYNSLYGYVDAASIWRDLAISSARSAVELGVDGIFSDGPVEVDSWGEGTARAFLARHGRTLDDLGENEADQLLKSRVNREIVHTFVHDLSAAIKEINPNCLFYTNLGLDTPPGRTLDAQDLVASEGGFGYYGHPREVKHWKTGFTSRVLEGWSGGKPRVNFISADHKPWNRVLKPGADVVRQAANAVQHGSSYWIGYHSPAADLQRPEAQAMTALNRIVTGHAEVFGPSRSLASVALYWSFDSLALDPTSEASDFYARTQGKGELVAGHYTESQGWCRALIASHLPFDVVSSGFTTLETLQSYKTLILPAVCILSDEEVALFTRWVEYGGRLIVSADPGRLDEGGTALPTPALAALLGIGELRGIQDRGTYNYMTVQDNAPAWVWPDTAKLLPDYTRALLITTIGSHSVARFHEPVTGQYNALTSLAGDAILQRVVGKGEAVLFAGNIGETYGNYGLPSLRKLMANAVTGGHRHMVEIENAPGFIEVSVRQSKDAPVTTVHIVNHGGDFEQPLETPVQLRDVRIHLKTQCQSARTLLAATELPIEMNGEYATVIVPQIGIYEAIVFQ